LNARKSLDQLKQSYDKLIAAKQTYQASLVGIQVKAGEAWLAFAGGDKNKAIELMTTAADLEDKTDKHPVTPGPIIPARELLGDMYMEMGNAKNALAAYESDLRRQPKRFNGLNGAAEAAAKYGDVGKARLYYDEMLKIASSSSGSRPELAKATAYVGRH
jgi:tetratricopeptide (TPR) repeat protein